MKTNVQYCIIIGVVLATLYSAYALLLYALKGHEVVETSGVTIGAIVSAYYFGGLAGGTLAGLLWPLVRWRLGATVVGIIVAIFVFVGIIAAMKGGGTLFEPQTYLDAAIIGTLVGSVAANLTWRKPG